MSDENPGMKPEKGRRRAWPPDVAYTPWKMWAVGGGLAAMLLAVIFVGGALYGRNTAEAGHNHEGGNGVAAAEEQILYWTCSMHPQIKLPKQTPCPICFMDLVPVKAGSEDDSDAPRIALSKRARQLARVQTSSVERKILTREIQLVGKIAADETGITHVSSYVPGRLDRLFVNYTGIMVRKGDHLAEIYSPQLLVAQQEYLIALETGKAGKAAPQTRSIVADTGSAMLEAARRKLELWGIPKDEIDQLARTRQPSDHMRLDAPLEGWVLERQGFEGMYVDTGMRIFTLADLRTVWVLLDAYELDVGSIRAGQEAEFETEAFPGDVFKGRISYVDPVLNPSTRTIKVRLVVPNPDLKLKPEMFVRARVKVEVGEDGTNASNSLAGKWICPMHPEIVKDEPGQCDKCGMDLESAESLGYAAAGRPTGPALAVPHTAVLVTGKRAVVYVESEKDGEPVYEGRTVELGPRAGDYYVVKAGLNEGERVVTRGALMIDSALQIRAKPSMMQPPALVSGEQDTKRPQVESRYVAGAMYHQHMSPVIDSYLALTSALAGDDVGKSAEAIAGLRKAVKSAEPHGLEGDDATLFKEQVQAIADSLPKAEIKEVESLRQTLPKLTEAVEMYLRSFGHEQETDVVKAYCSMALDNQGANWLQTGETIANPYFGAKMLRCGEVREVMSKPEDPSSAVPPEEAAPQSHYVADAMYHRHVRPVIEGYLALTAALGQDNQDAALAALGKMREGLENAKPHGIEGETAGLFKEQVESIRATLPKEGQHTIDDLRNALPALTGAVKIYLRTFGHSLNSPVYEAYCPMAFDDKGAAWLQTDPKVLNAYFGKKMLRCGEIRGAIERNSDWNDAQ